MNKYLSILVIDSKNIKRDPTLSLLFFMPFAIIFIIRIGLPLLSSYFPAISDFYLEIISFFALLNCVFPGFILSFILLDEKDLNLFPVLNTTPVTISGFLAVRITFLAIYGFACSLAVLFFNGLLHFPFLKLLMTSLLCALNTPIIILIISTKAKNKIEGLTLLKVANIVLLIPLLIFFVNSPWEILMAIFPAFWVYHFIEPTESGTITFILGILYLTAINWCVYRYAIKATKSY